MERPLFTVNIAVYNQRNNIPVILEALKDQSVKSFEVSITDDGSDDGTKEYCQKLLEDGSLPFTFRYLWQEKKGFRLAASKNMGIKEAEGKYFLSLEGDIIPHKDMLKEYVQRLTKTFITETLDNQVLLGVRHDIKQLPTVPLDYDKLDSEVISTDFRLNLLGGWQMQDVVPSKPYMYASGCNLLLPTKELKEIGGWDEGYQGYGKDDYDVVMMLWHLKKSNVSPCVQAYAYHIDHPHGFNQESEDRFYKKERELGL